MFASKRKSWQGVINPISYQGNYIIKSTPSQQVDYVRLAAGSQWPIY